MDIRKGTKPEKRLIFFAIAAGVMTLFILGAYFKVMVLDPRPATTRVMGIQERGPIYDRNGRLLALSTRADTLTAWTPNLDKMKLRENVQALGPILSINPQDLESKLTKEPGFLYIKRKISPEESRQVEGLLSDGALKGFSLEQEFVRSYPEKHLGSQLVGYVNLDNQGVAGMERAYDDKLSSGTSVWLTLDTTLQFHVMQIAQSAWKENQPDAMNIIVADAKSGELLAYESLPDFDPNRFRDFSDNERLNHGAIKAYEPGSVFKVFSVASLLDSGAITENDEFFCNGFYERTLPSGEVIKIKCMGTHGQVSPANILKYSCNAGAGYASDRIDSQHFETYLRNFGFGKATDLPIENQSNGILKSYKQWSGRSKPTIAFGQEIGVSALQIVEAATVIANDGKMVKLQGVKKITDVQGALIQEFRREEVRQVIKSETANRVLEMLRNTIEEGATVKARIQGIDIAGKTGTAQVLDTATGRYSEKNYIASILIFLPAKDPRYIIYVNLENPKGSSYFGGQIAAPVAKEVGEKIISYYGLVRKDDQVIQVPGSTVIPPLAAFDLGQTMPDLRGYPKRSLMNLLARKDIEVTIRGDGWVVKQSPAPGTALSPGALILLELE